MRATGRARSAPVATGAVVLAAATLALAAIAAPTAGAAAVPWGAGCTTPPPGGERTSSDCGASLAQGRAVAPPGAPAEVRAVIAAANRIDHRPYVWGGGHLSWTARGYDCSGAVGYALHGAGMLEAPMVSGQLAGWGEPGVGHWITVYANADHVFMEVAGLRFDTRDDEPGVSGPRWHTGSVDPTRFVARHSVGF